MYKTIIFDWNGTLLDDRMHCFDIVCKLAIEYKVPEFTLEDYLRYFNFPIRDYYIQLGFDFKSYTYEDVAQKFIQQYHQNEQTLQLFPGVKKQLEILYQNKIELQILSAYHHERLNQLVSEFELTKFFSQINGIEDDLAKSKSHLMQRAIVDRDPNSILMIGDTLHDAEIAYEHQIDCLLVSQGHQSKERLLKNPFGFSVFDNLEFVTDELLKTSYAKFKREKSR